MGGIDGGKEKIDLKFLDDISESEREVLEYFSSLEFETEENYKLRLRKARDYRDYSNFAGLKIYNGHIENLDLQGKKLATLPEYLFQRGYMILEVDLTPKGQQLNLQSRYDELREYYRKSPN